MRIKKSFVLVSIAATVAMLATVLILAVPALAQDTSNSEAKRAVPFSEVEVNDGFMRDYTKLVICKVIPTAITNVELEKGGIPNIKACGEWHKSGKSGTMPTPKGERYVDSDVHKVLESMCMALDTPANGDQEIINAQAAIKTKLDKWMEFYVYAPELDGDYAGYFDSFYSLDAAYEKYSNYDNHELYCQGHFMEAAVAHYRYSKHVNPNNPDKRLLDVAVKSADHIVKTFGYGEGQRVQVPGHQEIELALMKLAKLCQEIGGDYAAKADGYIDKAKFFLELRGKHEGRTVDIESEKRIYYQDLAPVSEQTTAIGHAVRAQYMYTGMCELATIKPEYASKYNNALTSLWDDITNKKQYITGGIGDKVNNNEGFEDPYKLPNVSSYCETCAGVANMLWNRSMSTLYDGSQYAEQIETDLYNNVLGCVNFDGNKFYYENRLATLDSFDRSTWFGTACCPPNYTRTILQVGGCVYNTTSNDIFINQFISNNANFNVGNNKVNVVMNSGFPYSGNGTITVKPTTDANFNVQIRKPSWTDNYTIKVNGSVVTPQIKDGYLVISDQTWSSTSGTTIEFDFNMPLKYEKSNPLVTSNNGLVALRHGPILYCAEACDNTNFDLDAVYIVQNGQYAFTKVDSLGGGTNPYKVKTVYTLDHAGKAIVNGQLSDITWKFIPYYARCNRELGAMSVFVHDGSEPVKLHMSATPSASFTSVEATDSCNGLNDGSDDPGARWTSYKHEDFIPNPSVTYEFNKPVKFNGFRIWWYDDGGGVQRPDDFSFTVDNSTTGEQYTVNINGNSEISATNDGQFIDYTFGKTYEGTKITINIKNDTKKVASGIVEWELMDTVGNTLENVRVAQLPAKTEYVVGEAFDPAGMVINAGYTDQMGQSVANSVTNYICSPSVFEHPGQQDVTISYTEEGPAQVNNSNSDGVAVVSEDNQESDNSQSANSITKTTIVTVNVKEAAGPTPPSSGEDVDPASSATTGDSNWVMVLSSIMLLALAGTVLVVRRKKLK